MSIQSFWTEVKCVEADLSIIKTNINQLMEADINTLTLIKDINNVASGIQLRLNQMRILSNNKYDFTLSMLIKQFITIMNIYTQIQREIHQIRNELIYTIMLINAHLTDLEEVD